MTIIFPVEVPWPFPDLRSITQTRRCPRPPTFCGTSRYLRCRLFPHLPRPLSTDRRKSCRPASSAGYHHPFRACPWPMQGSPLIKYVLGSSIFEMTHEPCSKKYHPPFGLTWTQGQWLPPERNNVFNQCHSIRAYCVYLEILFQTNQKYYHKSWNEESWRKTNLGVGLETMLNGTDSWPKAV